ncbi:MAG TPA: hypothetical protein VGS58_13250 [Candidatus Sulfopaludibacter sp.]|nr:hypothetical protein [Candidatus Sulfopaludibacter sp.]
MGSSLANTTLAGTPPLTTLLGGDTVTVTEAKGAARLALLYFVSPAQINFVMPAGTASGPATITVAEASGPVFVAAITASPTDPGVFFVTAGGQNLVQAVVFDQPQPGGAPLIRYTTTCSSSSCSANPVVLNGTDKVYLELFGTGIQGTPAGSVSATINGVNVPVTFAGWSQQFPGVDQVNVGPLPSSLWARARSTWCWR